MAQGFQELIGKAVLDPQFRSLLFNNPDAAMQGFNLTPQQQAALNNITPERFQAAVDYFNNNMPGPGDDVLKKAVKKAIDLYKEMPGSDAFYKPQTPGNDAFYKEMPGSDVLIKGESYPGADVVKKHKGADVPQRAAAGGIIAILIGLLLFFGLLVSGYLLFAPGGMVGGSISPMMSQMACPSDPSLMGDGSVMPVGEGGAGELLPAVQVGDVNGEPAADVNGDGHAAPAGDVNGDGQALAIREAALAPSAFAKIEFSFFSFFNNLRMTMGNGSFFDSSACMMEEEGQPQPTPPDETTGGSDQGSGGLPNQTTGGTTTGGSDPSGGGAEPSAPASDPCADHGGIQYQGTTCVCPGLVDSVLICFDGLKLDTPTTEQCVPTDQCGGDSSGGGNQSGGGQQCSCQCKVVCDPANPQQCSKVCLDSCSGLKCQP